MEEARQLAVQSLREEFAGMIERITERFSTNGGAPKIFKNSTVNNFYEYFETFKQRNIFKDTELEEIVSRAQAILGGRSAEDIRNDENLKNRIRCGMDEVEKAMSEIFIMPRRKIMMN
jgi:cobalamin biosynthesis protein CbiG